MHCGRVSTELIDADSNHVVSALVSLSTLTQHLINTISGHTSELVTPHDTKEHTLGSKSFKMGYF